ncbi:glycosyl transferase [Flavobacterium sp.]|uniref:glycosyl transferase n=1 Tax=Flavobacterium sp. TaxID=239 RepID=UPI002FDE999C
MKLKELPFSLIKTLKLVSIPVSKIKNAQSEKIPVIVSLTTIPSRMDKVHITLRSILTQTKRPEKLLLWINEKDQHNIPNSIQSLVGDILELHFTPHTSSHKKLIPTLLLYPDRVIVTCDDDLIYESTWLEKLYQSHLKYPKDIICNKIRQIAFDEHSNLQDYKKWVFKNPNDPIKNMAIGAGGILYPPKSLHELITNYELALQLAPKNDDLWFKAMAVLNNTTVRQADDVTTEFLPIYGTQKISLKKINVDQNFNVNQWQDLTNYFQLKINN